MHEINQLPLKTGRHESPVRIADIGYAKDAQQIQTNIVRVDGQRSVYLPVLKQGGDTNTIAVVDGVKGRGQASVRRSQATGHEAWCSISRDFVKTAIETLLHEGGIGLFLTSLMILIFLGSMRATVAVFFSIPLSALAAFIALAMGGSSINSMVLGGLALAFSRLIDNSVVVLENIYRHLEMGEPPEVAAEKGGREVALPVLAATLTTVVVFFPVTFLYGVSQFLFSALALAVVLSLFASYAVAMTVVPLFCARFIKAPAHHGTPSAEARYGRLPPAAHRQASATRFNVWFNDRFERFLERYDRLVRWSRYAGLYRRWLRLRLLFVGSAGAVSAARAGVLPAHRRRAVRDQPQSAHRHTPRRDGSRSRQGRRPGPAMSCRREDLGMIVSNIGVDPGSRRSTPATPACIRRSCR